MMLLLLMSLMLLLLLLSLMSLMLRFATNVAAADVGDVVVCAISVAAVMLLSLL